MIATTTALKALVEQRGHSSLGNSRREEILQAASKLMVEKGLTAVTIRGVARAAGMAPGNLGYYFASHDDLLQALLDWVLEPYLRAFEFLRANDGNDPIVSLRAVLDYVLEDLASEETTMFFPELWVLANRDEHNAKRMRDLYNAYMEVLRELITAARPDLSRLHIDELALFICASIEGQTVFIGYKRPYAEHRAALKSIALEAMITVVVNHAGDISGTNDEEGNS